MRRHGEQLAAHRADARIELAGVYQRLDEVGEQQDVGIQGQDPIAVGKLDGLVLGGREADVFLVLVDSAAVLELFQDVDGAVGRGIIDDNHFLQPVLLLEHRFQAALDKAAAVVSDYRDGDEVVLRHEREPARPSSLNIFLP